MAAVCTTFGSCPANYHVSMSWLQNQNHSDTHTLQSQRYLVKVISEAKTYYTLQIGSRILEMYSTAQCIAIFMLSFAISWLDAIYNCIYWIPCWYWLGPLAVCVSLCLCRRSHSTTSVKLRRCCSIHIILKQTSAAVSLVTKGPLVTYSL